MRADREGAARRRALRQCLQDPALGRVVEVREREVAAQDELETSVGPDAADPRTTVIGRLDATR